MGKERIRWKASVKRLKLLVEGRTEQAFATRISLPHFFVLGLQVETRILLTGTSSRTGGSVRGSISNYGMIRKDLNPILHECRRDEVWASTMFDFYALPKDFPGRSTLPLHSSYNRVEHLEKELLAAWKEHPQGSCLIPYIQLHEFETLLLSDIDAFEEEFFEADDARQITLLNNEITGVISKNGYTSIEEVNDGESTSPSKRIIRCIPAYQYRKETAGTNIAERIGIKKMRECCPHFNEWISRLEKLAVQ